MPRADIARMIRQQPSPIAAAFRRLMTRRGLTIAQVARENDMDPATISNWLAGRRDPRCSQVWKLCERYGKSEAIIEVFDRE